MDSLAYLICGKKNQTESLSQLENVESKSTEEFYFSTHRLLIERETNHRKWANVIPVDFSHKYTFP